MKKSFLVVSHTEGGHPFEQRTILKVLVSNLKKLFPDCFVLIASNCEVEYEIQKIVDYVLIDKITHNIPHGYAELQLVKKGLQILKEFECQNVFKLAYDFIIDESNYHVFDQWLSHNKDFVSCYWTFHGLGIGTWVWYSKIDLAQQIFDFNNLECFAEWRVLQSIQEKNLLDRCYLYENSEKLFDGDWSKCDLVNHGGRVLKYNYGTVCAVLPLNDNSEISIFLTLQSLVYQLKKPNHVLFIDYRTEKKDLRTIPQYQELFSKLSEAFISWNLIYYSGENATLHHLKDLNHNWCWLIDPTKFIQIDHLRNIYTCFIKDTKLGCILDQNQNLVYRNHIVDISDSNFNLTNYVIENMKKTNYNYLEL